MFPGLARSRTLALAARRPDFLCAVHGRRRRRRPAVPSAMRCMPPARGDTCRHFVESCWSRRTCPERWRRATAAPGPAQRPRYRLTLDAAGGPGERHVQSAARGLLAARWSTGRSHLPGELRRDGGLRGRPVGTWSPANPSPRPRRASSFVVTLGNDDTRIAAAGRRAAEGPTPPSGVRLPPPRGVTIKPAVDPAILAAPAATVELWRCTSDLTTRCICPRALPVFRATSAQPRAWDTVEDTGGLRPTRWLSLVRFAATRALHAHCHNRSTRTWR